LDRREDIHQLLVRYINNDISEEAFQMLLQYLSMEEHEAQLKEWIRNEMHRGEPDHDNLPEELQQLFGRLDQKLFERIDNTVKVVPEVKQVSKRRTYRRWMAAAGGVLIVVLVTGLAMLYKHVGGWGKSHPAASKTNDISPGGNRAFLAIGNGKRLELDSNQSAVLVQGTALRYEDGSLITSLETGSDTAGQVPESVVLSTPPGGQYRISLPDGTNVWVNAASSIRFTGAKRTVELNGEAYFEVAKNPDMPFVVQSGKQELAVLGTRFNVSAYPEDKKVVTTLVEGSVKITPEPGREPRMLVPGQQSVLNLNGGDFSVRKVDVNYYTSWKDGLFVFNRLPVQAILPQIERWYNVQFKCPASMGRVLMWGTVSRNVMLSEILEVLTLNTDLKFSLQGKTVLVSQKTQMN